jgi:hypothetical protein
MKSYSNYIAIALIFVCSLAHSATWVEVKEHGRNMEEAKQNCFRSAIQQVVGELIVGEVEVSGDTIINDFIGSYSAGYVDDFEIQEIYHEPGKITLHMRVRVAGSKIAERMRTNSKHSTTLSGEKLATKLETILEQRRQGDRIISRVLASYPHNAYILNSGANEINIGPRRRVYLDIPYEIQWSRSWIEALIETLDTVALNSNSCGIVPFKKVEELSLVLTAVKFYKDKTCGNQADFLISYKQPNDWLIQRFGFYFSDLATLDAINNELQTPVGHQHVGLTVDLKDAAGNLVATQCAQIPTDPLINYRQSQQEVESIHGITYRPNINGDTKVAGVVRIDAAGVDISNVTRADMRIERTCN